MSDPYKGSNAKPQVATPHSDPVKLNEYSNPKAKSSRPVNPQAGGLTAKLPKK